MGSQSREVTDDTSPYCVDPSTKGCVSSPKYQTIIANSMEANPPVAQWVTGMSACRSPAFPRGGNRHDPEVSRKPDGGAEKGLRRRFKYENKRIQV